MCCSHRTFAFAIAGLSIAVNILGIIGFGFALNGDSKMPEKEQAKIIYIIMIVCLIIFIGIAVLFIVGLLKKRHGFMLPFLVLTMITLIGLIGIVYAFVTGEHWLVGIGLIYSEAICLVVGYFILKTLYKLYKDIRNGSRTNYTANGSDAQVYDGTTKSVPYHFDVKN